MLVAHVWLQQQKQIYRLRNVCAGYVLYRALVLLLLSNSGGGKKPITWATVIECLRTAELNYLADSVEELFEYLPQPSLTPQPNNAGWSTDFVHSNRDGRGGCNLPALYSYIWLNMLQ